MKNKILFQVTEKRIEATRNGQKAMINCYKLVGNSCYGRLGKFLKNQLIVNTKRY